MASFDGVEFGERGNGGSTFPSHATTHGGVVTRIPGSSRVVLMQSSDRAYELQTTAKTDYAGYLALRNKVGTAGALELGAQRGTGTLLRVGPSVEVHPSGVFFVDLDFSLVSAELIGTPGAEGGYGNLYGNNLDGM
jgi:hypothetical protein